MLPQMNPMSSMGVNKKSLLWHGVHRRQKSTPLCRVQRCFEPAFAGGILPVGSALAPAYRVPQRRTNPVLEVLAQNLMLHHAHSRASEYIPRSPPLVHVWVGVFFYHQPKMQFLHLPWLSRRGCAGHHITCGLVLGKGDHFTYVRLAGENAT